MISFSICGSTLRPLPIPFVPVHIDNTRQRNFLQKNFLMPNGFHVLRVIGVMKPHRKTPGMYASRVSMGSMAASTAVVCVLSLTPTPVSPIGGFFDLPLAHAQCCFTAETQVPHARVSEFPASAVKRSGQAGDRGERDRRGVGIHGVLRDARVFHGIDHQAPYFSARRPVLTLGDRRGSGRGATPVLMPGPAVAELAAGEVQMLAFADLGEIASQRHALTPAALSTHHGDARTECVLDGCDQGRDGKDLRIASDFNISGVYDPASRLLAPQDPAAAFAQTSHSGSQAQVPESGQTGDHSQGTTGGDQPTDGTKAEGEEFSGSAAPAGPDLTTSQEEAAIAGGWK